MAVAAPRSFHHFSAHFSPGYSWETDPFCEELFIWEGKICQRWPFNRAYSEAKMKAGDYLGGSITEDVLLTVVPTWPLTDYKFPVDFGPITPTDAIRSSQYRLLRDHETIAGEECAVFDCKDVDRIWVAVRKGICVMRRDIRNPNSGRLGQRIQALRVDQVAPGLWFPTEFSSQFTSARQGVKEDFFDREIKIRILRCVLNNDVSESVFVPVHQPGSLRVGKDNQFVRSRRVGRNCSPTSWIM